MCAVIDPGSVAMMQIDLGDSGLVNGLVTISCAVFNQIRWQGAPCMAK